MTKKMWLVEMPTRLYNEDVKLLAKEHKLTLIDAKFASQYTDEQIEQRPPKLTLKSEVKKDEHGNLFDPEIHKPEIYERGENKGKWKPKK